MVAWDVLNQSLMISGFVAVMMIAVEYVNVHTRGTLVRLLGASPIRQYVVAAVLGGTPGCLGAFASVALYAHGQLSLGALTATMVATSGDESFVMLALFPAPAIVLTVCLAALAVVVGWLADALVRGRPALRAAHCDGFILHEDDECTCLSPKGLLHQWRPPSVYRGTMASVLLVFILALLAGWIGPAHWDWKRVTLLVVTAFGLFVVATVPDHFLEDHLWRHVARRHVPRIFIWTFGILCAMSALDALFDLEALVAANRAAVMALAALVGILPESGPHLLFVTLYAAGTMPLGALVTSSIVQDGHGALPLLAYSRRDFLVVKAINLVVGLIIGALMTSMGY